MLTLLRSTILVLIGLTTAMASAADPKPSDLTEKERQDGWLQLFDGETTEGWIVEGSATVKDGVLILGGEKATILKTKVSFLAPDVVLDLLAPDGKALTGGGVVLPQSTQAAIGFTGVSKMSGTAGGLGSGRSAPGPVRVEVPAGSLLHIRKLAVKPSGTKPLFNGKDLTGWKVFADPKRAESKWTVTPAGELHLTNGPGDLQTEGAYGNFLLQLECKTNGPSLNSGVFFRCVPNQYQNGYEAQIHNGMMNNDPTKPADFGTGAIYRRKPARKIVAKDQEWFSLTVVADGPTLATWVNGVPVLLWTDERPAAENPRQGLRTAAGHLSIQGHDKTTDILFRNIRIVDYTAKSRR